MFIELTLINSGRTDSEGIVLNANKIKEIFVGALGETIIEMDDGEAMEVEELVSEITKKLDEKGLLL
ncbi:hypothetical protein [Oceanobacillus neutriphilus]|uniref:Uncharacterized protein n=1 Tax=Oceanobacillus neutriphilus TaxID=531815 RepID=A0ABQ2P3N9_9BACI|nr:hypothetical protein [Oceanobacillus neutriphilus]GGP17162.1 hypothetical protein GCM10011346_51990 [Oceanobacillus neutriphilus]